MNILDKFSSYVLLTLVSLLTTQFALAADFDDADGDGFPEKWEIEYGLNDSDVNTADDYIGLSGVFVVDGVGAGGDVYATLTEAANASTSIAKPIIIVKNKGSAYTGKYNGITGNVGLDALRSDALVIAYDLTDKPLFDGEGQAVMGIYINSGCALVGIKITGCLWGGLRCATSPVSNNLIDRCEIYGNDSNDRGGGIYTSGSDNWIRNSLIYNNNALNNAGGIDFNNRPNCYIDHCTIFGNTVNGALDWQINYTNGSLSTITNSIIWVGVGQVSMSYTHSSISNSIVSGFTTTPPGSFNDIDPEIDSTGRISSTSIAVGNAIGSLMAIDADGEPRVAPDIGADEYIDPFKDDDGDGYPYKWDSDDNLATGAGIPAPAAVVDNDPGAPSTYNGATVYSDLATALSNVEPDSIILVRQGVGDYDDAQITFADDGLLIISESGPEETVFAGNNNWGFQVNGNSVAIVGLTITSYTASWNGPSIGVYGSNALIYNCIISDSVSTADGGAIYINNSGALLRNSLLIDNSAANGGGIFAAYPFVIEHCTVFNNLASNSSPNIHVNLGGGQTYQVKNSIVWDPGLQAIVGYKAAVSESVINAGYQVVEEGVVITDDPMLDANGKLSDSDSSAIGQAGVLAMPLVKDAFGGSRDDGAPDIGAHEYAPPVLDLFQQWASDYGLPLDYVLNNLTQESDYNGDGLTDYQSYQLETIYAITDTWDPTQSVTTDVDGDDVNDWLEGRAIIDAVERGLSGLASRADVLPKDDYDGDGLTNRDESIIGSRLISEYTQFLTLDTIEKLEALDVGEIKLVPDAAIYIRGGVAAGDTGVYHLDYTATSGDVKVLGTGTDGYWIKQAFGSGSTDTTILQAAIDVNSGNISTNAAAISVNGAGISTNANGITTNANGITTNANGITTNANGITTNANGITTNANGITTNANGITTNANGITTNANGITTNANGITTNANGITTNANGITTNANGITTNANGITTNANEITTNANLISTNIQSISVLQGEIESKISSVNTMNDLISSVNTVGLLEGTAVNLLGYHEIGDGGGGILHLVNDSSLSANGVTIYEIDGVIDRFWKRDDSNIVNIKWAGAKGDSNSLNAFLNTEAFANSIEYLENQGGGTLYIPSGEYIFENWNSEDVDHNGYFNADLSNIEILGEGDLSILNGMRGVKPQAGGKNIRFTNFKWISDGITFLDCQNIILDRLTYKSRASNNSPTMLNAQDSRDIYVMNCTVLDAKFGLWLHERSNASFKHSENVYVQNSRFENTRPFENPAAVNILAAKHVVVENCVFESLIPNPGQSSYGVYQGDNVNNESDYITVRDCYSSNVTTGAAFHRANHVSVINNHFEGTTGMGIRIFEETRLKPALAPEPKINYIIQDNTLINGGIHVGQNTEGVIIKDNVIIGSDQDGIRSTSIDSNLIKDIQIINNDISNAKWGGIRLQGASNVLIDGNKVTNANEELNSDVYELKSAAIGTAWSNNVTVRSNHVKLTDTGSAHFGISTWGDGNAAQSTNISAYDNVFENENLGHSFIEYNNITPGNTILDAVNVGGDMEIDASRSLKTNSIQAATGTMDAISINEAGGETTVTSHGKLISEGQIVYDNTPVTLSSQSMGTLGSLDTIGLAPGTVLELLGYHSPGDGGGGTLYLIYDTNLLANGVTVYEIVGRDDWYWKRADIDRINVKWAGARGDGINPDDTAIAMAISALESGNTLYFPESNTYRTENSTVVPEGVSVVMDDTIVMHYSAGSSVGKAGIIIGSPGVKTKNQNFKLSVFRDTRDWNDEGFIGIQINNAVSCNIEIVQASQFTIGVQCIGNQEFFAYNRIELGEIIHNKYGLDITTIEGVGGYGSAACNENIFIKGRFSCYSTSDMNIKRYGVRIHGDYICNNNTFMAPSFELSNVVKGTFSGNVLTPTPSDPDYNSTIAVPVLIESGNYNRFLNCRSERNSRVFAEIRNDAQNNEFEIGYLSNGHFHLYDNSANEIVKYDTVIDSTSTKGGNTIVDSTTRLFKSANNTLFAVSDLYGISLDARHLDTDVARIPGIHIIGNDDIDSLSTSLPAAFEVYKNVSRNSADNAIELIGSRGIGVFVDTHELKRFVIRRSVLENGNTGRLGIRCYGINGNSWEVKHPYHYAQDINDEDNDGDVTEMIWKIDNSSPSWLYGLPASSNWGGAYHQSSSNNKNDFYIEVHEDVKKIAVFFTPDTGSSLKIRGFSISSIDTGYASVYPGYNYPNLPYADPEQMLNLEATNVEPDNPKPGKAVIWFDGDTNQIKVKTNSSDGTSQRSGPLF